MLFVHSGDIMSDKQSFFKRPGDTATIIGVNIAIAAFMLSMIISTSQRVDSFNERIDACQTRSDGIQMMVYDALKEFKK